MLIDVRWLQYILDHLGHHSTRQQPQPHAAIAA